MRLMASGKLAMAAMVLFVGGCRADSDAVTDPSRAAAFAKGGGGTTAIAVTSVSPSTATVDTVLEVVVNGNGFERGASAKWSINGDTTQVHVLSTTFVNGGRLKALLQVPANAPIGSYDVEVYLRDGKKGVGAELFQVQGKPVHQTAWTATFNIPAAGASLTSVENADYADGVCGVLAKVYQLLDDYQDGNLQLNNPRAKDRSCGSTPRMFTVTYPDNGMVQSYTGNMNINLMGTVTEASGPGARQMNIAITGSDARCTRLGFGNALGGTRVMVTRVSATQWQVASQPGGSAACLLPNGQTEFIADLTVNLTVTLN